MLCPVHNLEFKLVPAGVSKPKTDANGNTIPGRPYQAFWACPERGCKQRPPVNAQGQDAKPRHVDTFAAGLDKDKEEMKWQEIGAQKNRSNLAAARLQAGPPYEPAWVFLTSPYLTESWVLNGKVVVKPAETKSLEQKIETLKKPTDFSQQEIEGQAAFDAYVEGLKP